MEVDGGVPAPDMRMLDVANLRKVKRQDSNESRLGSQQPYPLRPFLWACKLSYTGFLNEFEKIFRPALTRQTHKMFMNAYIEQVFCGKNRNGERDRDMRVSVRGRYEGLREGTGPSLLWYRLEMQLFDLYGEVMGARAVDWVLLSNDWTAMRRQLRGIMGSYLHLNSEYILVPEVLGYRHMQPRVQDPLQWLMSD